MNRTNKALFQNCVLFSASSLDELLEAVVNNSEWLAVRQHAITIWQSINCVPTNVAIMFVRGRAKETTGIAAFTQPKERTD